MSCCNSDARYFRRPNKRCCRQHPTSDDNTYSLAAKIPHWPLCRWRTYHFCGGQREVVNSLFFGSSLPQSWIGKSWNYLVRLPPCGYLVTLHNITRDHHPSSNLALHWPSHPSKKTTPSCQVDLLICTQKKRLVEDFPKMIFSGALRSLTDWIDWCRKTCDLIERMPLNQPFCTPLKLTSLLQKWCKLGISHG